MIGSGSGFTPAQVAGHLGVTWQDYLELEAGTRWPSSTVWQRMVALYGWSTRQAPDG